MRKDLPSVEHNDPISKADKKIIVSGLKEKAKDIFEDLIWQMKRNHTYPSVHYVNLQDAMRLAFNGMLGNAPELFSL